MLRSRFSGRSVAGWSVLVGGLLLAGLSGCAGKQESTATAAAEPPRDAVFCTDCEVMWLGYRDPKQQGRYPTFAYGKKPPTAKSKETAMKYFQTGEMSPNLIIMSRTDH